MEIILAGRGESVYGFDWDAHRDTPIMAVSSGIFGLPGGLIPEHFVTMDEPKFFMHPLTDAEISWGEDKTARQWPFWKEPAIVKHVTQNRDRPMNYRLIPPEVVDVVPTHLHGALIRAMMESQHVMGFQPGWGDYPNVQRWLMDKRLPPNFSPIGPFGLDEIRNSLLFAIQVAQRIGFQRLMFIGCDLVLDCYAEHRALLKRWSKLAAAEGFEWINLSERSALRHFMPTEALAA